MVPYFKNLVVSSLMFLMAGSAYAASDTLMPLSGEYKYVVKWNGITIGRVILAVTENKNTFYASIDTKTRGIVDIFSPLRSVVTVDGVITESGDYLPTLYQSRSHSDEGGRTAKLTYDESGTLTERIREPLDDPNWRPEVPLEELVDVADPITAFLRLRRELFGNLKAKVKDTKVKTYDGRRLAEFKIRAINPGTKMIHGEVTKMINTVAFRRPINGYTPKELAKYDKGDPTVHVYFSHDFTLMPLAIEFDVTFGSISAVLEKR